MIQLVFAHNGYNFGSHDGMPWPHISKDFQNFKERTMNSTMIMGAKTFESLPGILPGRKHIVVCDKSRTFPTNKKGEKAHQYITEAELEALLILTKCNKDRNLSIIGGAKLLEFALPYVDQVIKTSVKISPLDQKEVTTWLKRDFLDEVESYSLKESHFYQIDYTTTICEQIFVKDF